MRPIAVISALLLSLLGACDQPPEVCEDWSGHYSGDCSGVPITVNIWSPTCGDFTMVIQYAGQAITVYKLSPGQLELRDSVLSVSGDDEADAYLSLARSRWWIAGPDDYGGAHTGQVGLHIEDQRLDVDYTGDLFATALGLRLEGDVVCTVTPD